MEANLRVFAIMCFTRKPFFIPTYKGQAVILVAYTYEICSFKKSGFVFAHRSSFVQFVSPIFHCDYRQDMILSLFFSATSPLVAFPQPLRFRFQILNKKYKKKKTIKRIYYICKTVKHMYYHSLLQYYNMQQRENARAGEENSKTMLLPVDRYHSVVFQN